MKTIIKDEVINSDLIAIVDAKGNKITYKELAQKAEKLSGDIEERSVVFFLCDHQMETVETLYQILYLNRVPLLLPADIDRELLENLIAVYQPQYLYCSKAHEMAAWYQCVMEWENHVLTKTGNQRYPIHPDVALLLSTSGTTGSAKLVKISYDNLYHNAKDTCLHLGIQKGQKGLSPLPIHYTYGFAFCLWHWHCGATLLLTEELVISKKFQEFYTSEKVNNFAATPFTYQMLQKIRFWDKEKVEYLHFAASGGAQLPESDQVSLISIMKEKFWILYGQTECTCIISGMNFDENNIKLGSVGKALATMETILEDETKELMIKSNSVCMGYANQIAQLAEGDVNHGILHTGDVAYIDEEGCIYLRGRLTRYVKILGKRIGLDEIEKYLKGKIQSAEFACIGSDDHICVFHTDMEENLNKEIPVMLDKSMKIPNQYVHCHCIEEIPRNSAGKIQYKMLGEIEADGKKDH